MINFNAKVFSVIVGSHEYELLTFSEKQFNPQGLLGSIFCCSAQVGSAIFGLSLDLENFP